MKKIFIITALIAVLCSCEKFETAFNSNSCTIENGVTTEEMVSPEIVANLINENTQVILYEVSAKVEDEKYAVRYTNYALNYGEITKVILDSRTKYVRIGVCKTADAIIDSSRYEETITWSTDFISVEKNMYVKLDSSTLIFGKPIDN